MRRVASRVWILWREFSYGTYANSCVVGLVREGSEVICAFTGHRFNAAQRAIVRARGLIADLTCLAAQEHRDTASEKHSAVLLDLDDVCDALEDAASAYRRLA